MFHDVKDNPHARYASAGCSPIRLRHTLAHRRTFVKRLLASNHYPPRLTVGHFNGYCTSHDYTNCRTGAGCQPRAIACGVVVISRKCDAPCSSVQTRGVFTRSARNLQVPTPEPNQGLGHRVSPVRKPQQLGHRPSRVTRMALVACRRYHDRSRNRRGPPCAHPADTTTHCARSR